jgi:hypothetical protein
MHPCIGITRATHRDDDHRLHGRLPAHNPGHHTRLDLANPAGARAELGGRQHPPLSRLDHPTQQDHGSRCPGHCALDPSGDSTTFAMTNWSWPRNQHGVPTAAL